MGIFNIKQNVAICNDVLILRGEREAQPRKYGTKKRGVGKKVKNYSMRRYPFSRAMASPLSTDKLRELAASIQREGLIEPIVVRPKRDRYELIAGERRFRAVRDFTQMGTIQAQIVIAGDLQARRISAAENLQREDLSAIETIEAIVEIMDAELVEDEEYAAMGKKPADRVKTLLAKLDSVRRSKELVLRFMKTFTLSLRGAKRRSNLNKAHKLRQEIASLTLAMTTF